MATTIIKRSDKTAELTWAEMDQNLENLRTAIDTHSASTTNPHNVTAAQAGAEPAGAVDAHKAATDPHPQYETSAEAQTKVDTHANKTGTAVHGLGTAATANVTIGPTDGTTGRLLKVGDFGVGGYAQPLGLADANTLPLGSLASVNGVNGDATINNWPVLPDAPATPVYWNISTYGLDTRTTQIAIQAYNTVSSVEMYIRNKHDTNWYPWRKVYNQSNILGTVGQSGGVPTGAIIEKGSNANGDYTKFADGTIICTHSAAKTFPTGATSADWTFPATFIAGPVVDGRLCAVSSGSHRWGAEWVTTSLVRGFFFNDTGAGATGSFMWLAIGRWY